MHHSQNQYLDDLTGALNRRYLREALPRVFDEMRALGLPLSILVLDLDNFKAINDTYGHLEGDAVLRELVAFLKAKLRHSDLIIRYGGDEFILVLPHTDQDTAWKVASRLLDDLRKTPLHGHEITGSIGVATFPADGWSLNDLFARADEALYRAKNLGRNRVESAHTRTPSLEWPVAFIPRTREERALEQAIARKVGMVLVTGPAGIGKTRLVTEFLDSRKIPFLRGNAYALFQGMPYAPFLEMLQTALQQSPDLLERIPSLYAEDIRNLLNRSALEGSRSRLFEAILRVFEASGTEILMLDDIQWLDGASQELLYFLLRSGMRFVATLRKEEQERVTTTFLHALFREGLLEEIPLPPLTREQVRVLLQRALRMAPDEAIVDTLFRFSGGNPYLVGEILSDLYRHGYLRFRNVWELRLPPSYVPPRSVETLVTYKLGLLSPEHARLLEAAAVAGPAFDVDFLAELTGKTPVALVDLLEDLVRVQILEETPEGFAFREDVIREAVLERMSALRRRTLHARAAEISERRNAPPEVRAFHLHHAGERERAFRAFLHAIDDAMAMYAYPVALRLSELAMENVSTEHDRHLLLYRRGKIFWFLGEYNQAESAFQELLNAADALGELLGPVVISWLQLLVARGHQQKAVEEAERYLKSIRNPDYRLQIQLEKVWALIQLQKYGEARSLLKGIEKDVEKQGGEPLAKLLNLRAQIETERERWKPAEKAYQKALEVYRKLGDRRGEGVILTNLAGLFLAQDRPDVAMEYYKQALRVYEEIGYLEGRIVTLGDLGVVYNTLGYVDAAIQALQEAVLLAHRMDYRRILSGFYGQLAWAYAYKGEKERALGFAALALEQAEEQGQRQSLFFRALEKAYILLLYHDHDQAREILQTLEGQATRDRIRERFWWWLTYLELALETGDFRRIPEGFQALDETLRDLKGRSLRLYAFLIRARGHAVRGEKEEALHHLEKARKILRRLRIPLTRGEFYLEQGKVYASLGDFPRALRSFRQAEKIFENLGVALLQERAGYHIAEILSSQNR